jgi:hypothetical protein
MKLCSVSVHAAFLLVVVTVHQVWLCVVFINKLLVRWSNVAQWRFSPDEEATPTKRANMPRLV